MSESTLSKIHEHAYKVLRWTPDAFIEEYKLEFLGMPVEVSCLDFFHPSNREEWVNISRYCDFLHQKCLWSGDHFISAQSARRFFLGLRGQRAISQYYSTWTPTSPEDSNDSGHRSDQIIVISSDEDEEPIEDIVRRRQQKAQKAREVIEISSDSGEPSGGARMSCKRKALSEGTSSQRRAKRPAHINIMSNDELFVFHFAR